MQSKTLWIIGGVTLAGVVVWVIASPKKKVPAKPAAATPPGGTGPAPPPVGGADVTVTAAPGGPSGNNVYSKAGLTVRSSPEIDNGWGGFLSNEVKVIDTAGVFVGNIVSDTIDNNAAADSSGNIYTWYLINPAPGIGFSGGGSYYVRQDQITIK